MFTENRNIHHHITQILSLSSHVIDLVLMTPARMQAYSMIVSLHIVSVVLDRVLFP